MAAGGGDGQLAVGLQTVIDRSARQLFAAVAKAARRQHDGLLAGKMEIGLAADEVSRPLLPQVVEDRLLPRPRLRMRLTRSTWRKQGWIRFSFLMKSSRVTAESRFLERERKPSSQMGEMSVNGMALTFSIQASHYI